MPVISSLYTAGGVLQSSAAGVYTLADATTYYAEFDEVKNRSRISVHWKYSAALVAAITIEASNRYTDEISTYAAVGSGWATTSAATISPAASAGETVAHYADYNAARLRAKIVVTTGGTLRGDTHVKEG